uniref:Calmodulin-binding transcription activator 1 n=1 Tax=Tetraodon nigroviridis TaxID=99883 RepID=H3D4S6_TETNG
SLQCLYGCYVHSSIIPTFHRRCYWLLQNPDIVLVHYLNVPAIEDCGKPCGPILCSINTDKKEWAKWTKEELIGQLKPMFHGIKWTCSNGNSSGFSVEQLVQQILDSHQTKPPPRTHNCLCTGTLGAGSSVHHKCNSAKHRIISPKVDPRSGGYSSAHSEVQNNDVSEGKTEHSSHGGGKCPGGGAGGGSAREKRNGKVHKPTLLHQNSTEVSSTNQVEVPDTTQNSPVSISSGLNSDPDMADSPVVTDFDPDCFLNNPKQGQTYGGSAMKTEGSSSSSSSSGNSSSANGSLQRSPSISDGGYAFSSALNQNRSPNFFLQDASQTAQAQQQRTPPPPPSGSPGSTQSKLCLQPCCSPQSLSGGAGGGGSTGEAGSLSYMTEVVSAAVAQGMGMLQATGRLFMVTDYSPEWSYPEGGVKVLITGPWQEASSNYSCLFDQISVPASLIQPGVLRCYCPAHDTGLVTLQVAISNQIISNSVVFEYKARALPSLPSSQHDWLSLDDNQFRMSILERLEQMERRMAEMASHQQPSSAGSGGTCVSGQMQASSSFESRVVVVCEKMMSRACWAKSKHLIHSKTFRGMTLLHLAAGQGYANLIQTLIKWRTKHADSIDLELEVDPLNVDHFSCTPLMWACALGHLEAAVILYKWDRRALAIPDSLGRLPLSIARSRGHTKLAECLEQLQSLEQQQLHKLSASPKSVSSEGPSADKCLPMGSSTGTTRWTSRESYSSNSLGRKAVGVGASGSLGKEKLVNRLRQRDQLGMLVMADREMTDAELLSYREDLENQDCLTQMDDLQVNMMTLAEHIIEATPERIKRENFSPADSLPLDTSGVSNTMNWLANYLGDVEQLPSIIHLREGALERSTLPSPADWSEFINASNSKVERDLAQLTLSDPEQRELYEAARLVQTAFCKYKGRPLREQQEVAAAVIQRCYKKYKQLTWIALKYALYKKMTQAAILIQSKFRSYHEQKKFQQSRRAAVLIQQYYRSYKEFGRLKPPHRGAAAALVQHKLRGSLLTKRQDQAARKIMRFLRRCRHRVKELKRAREHETLQKSPLTM